MAALAVDAFDGFGAQRSVDGLLSRWFGAS
jgi:hypothetical protein